MKLFESLLSFTTAIRDDSFDDLEERAKLLVENTAYKEAGSQRKRQKEGRSQGVNDNFRLAFVYYCIGST